jgi:DNA-binding winged helix-turn-helix (wHTH) protein/TolB-like protein
MDGSSDRSINFGPFRLDPARGRLVRDDDIGGTIPVALGARAVAVLCAPAERSGELVAKQVIMDAVWPDTTVDDKNLAVQVSTLRQALEREGGQGDWIQTVPGRGYRFIAPVARKAEAETAPRDRDHASVVDVGARSSLAVSRLRSPTASVTALMLVCAAALGWAIRGTPLPAAYSPQDRRQSIIVLPFENSSTSPVQDEVAASVTREVIDIFARDKATPSIPAAVAAAYRGTPIDLRRIGREHGVHFALLGNSRQQDGRLIVSATLYETDYGNQVWGQRFELRDGHCAFR